MTLYIMVGPPLSGKSTIAKRLAQGKNILRINRDELRIMLKGKYVNGNPLVESVINAFTRYLIVRCILSGEDLIIDATHCKEKYINDIKDDIPKDQDCIIKYIVCDEPLWKLKYRNIIRYIKTGIWIPVQVIENMHHTFQSVKLKIANNEI